LRYWDLVMKYVDDDGKHRGGLWVVTDKGTQFIYGGSIHSHVWSYRGDRVEYDGNLIFISRYLPKEYKQREEYAAEALPTAQGSLFNE